MYKICVLVALFLIYSLLGWIIETTYVFVKDNKFVNRGFLIGPVIPIYGTGGMLIFMLFNIISRKKIFIKL